MASASQPESSEKEILDWSELPRDLTYNILSKIGTIDILNSENVCSTWRSICQDPVMWHRIDMPTDDRRCDSYDDLVDMCRHAVDRSCGDLEYISIEHFGTDDLLGFIADSSSSLRHLRLLSCKGISNEGVIKVFPKLSMLEEVEIFDMEFTKEALEAIGRSCPLLKTFKYNRTTYSFTEFKNDTEALAIATTMHELRNLHLFGNMLGDESLPAILDGCPYLEYLDLRWCSHVTLEGDVGQRCIDKIKVLRRPYELRDFYEYEISRPGDIRFLKDDYEFETSWWGDIRFSY